MLLLQRVCAEKDQCEVPPSRRIARCRVLRSAMMRGITAAGVLGNLLLHSGCASCPLPDVTWQMVIGDRTGQLSLLTVGTRDLFRPVPRFESAQIKGISSAKGAVSPVHFGWHDPSSGILATLEHGETWEASVVRVYDAQMRELGAHRSQGRRSGCNATCPSVYPGGQLIATVDGEGKVVVGRVGAGNTIEWQEVCEVPNVSADSYVGWLDARTIVVGGYRDTHEIRIDDHSCRSYGPGPVLGVLGGRPVTSAKGEIVVLGPEQEVTQRLGWRALPEYGGCWINRISPDGGFAAYESPSFLFGTALTFEHLASGRRVSLRGFKAPIWMGSWHVVGTAASQAACESPRR